MSNNGLFADIKRNFYTAVKEQDKDDEMFSSGEINRGQYSLRTTANVLDGTLGNVIGEATSALIHDDIEEGIGKGVNYLMNTTGGKYAQGLAGRYPEQARDLGAAFSVAETLPFVKGVSTAVGAGRTVNNLTGADSGKGMLTASANNVIPGFYDPLMANAAVGAWAPKQVMNTMRDMADPRSRAMYREQGFTRATQEIIDQAINPKKPKAPSWTPRKINNAKIAAKTKLKESLSEIPSINKLMEKFDKIGKIPEIGGERRGIAQAQFSSRIHSQSGRKGGTDFLDELMRRSDLVEAADYYPGAYSDIIKANKLKPYALDATGNKQKMPLKMPDSDLDFIEDHFSTVWKESSAIPFRGDIPFSGADNPILVIKRPSAGSATFGGHYHDVLIRASYNTTVKNIFENTDKVTPEQLLAKLEVDAKASKGTDREFTVKGTAEDGGVWVTGAMAGQALTEGGINYISKVTPNGKIIGVMSDEHNLFEGIAGKIQKRLPVLPTLSAMRHLLPNRLVAVTPPMVYDVVGKRQGITYSHPKGERVDPRKPKELLQDIVDYKPSAAVLKAENQRNKGMLLTSAGAVGMTNKQEEEGGR